MSPVNLNVRPKDLMVVLAFEGCGNGCAQLPQLASTRSECLGRIVKCSEQTRYHPPLPLHEVPCYQFCIGTTCARTSIRKTYTK